MADDPRCSCGAPRACSICESCNEHCLVAGDHDECERDDSLAMVVEARPHLDG